MLPPSVLIVAGVAVVVLGLIAAAALVACFVAVAVQVWRVILDKEGRF